MGDLMFEENGCHRIFINAEIQTVQGQYGPVRQEVRRRCRESEANLISSLTVDGLHAPAIDLDFPCRLVPSSTSGHYHLYLDRTMSWRQYKRLLRAMLKAGLIEPGFYKIAKIRKQTFLRTKPDKHVPV